MGLHILAGTFKGRRLKTPKNSSTRPTKGILRAALFNICQELLPGARFLDLFAGSGAMGCEAISRGASHATLVEHHPDAIACIRHNIEALSLSPTQVTLLTCDALRAIPRLIPPFHILYIDPPYDTPILSLVTSLIHHQKLAPHALLFLESRASSRHEEPIKEPHLLWIDTRKFGKTILTQYQYTERA